MFFDCPKIKPRQSNIILRIPYEVATIAGDFTAITKQTRGSLAKKKDNVFAQQKNKQI